MLIEKLNDFTVATEIPVSSDPRTRVYKFDRPRGPVYVMWSETGEVPPNLDYNISTGEIVTFVVESDTLLLTHIITSTTNTTPVVETRIIQNKQMTIKLDYGPIFLEGDYSKIQSHPQSSLPISVAHEQNHPNPFNPSATIEFTLPQSAFVTLKVYNLLDEEVATLIAEKRMAGIHKFNCDAKGLASGVYLYRLEARDPSTRSGQGFVQTKMLILMR